MSALLKSFGLLVGVFYTASISALTSDSINTTSLKNILDRFGTPSAHKSFDSYKNQHFNPLFDHGAWHGFLLPNSIENEGSFTGPLVIMEEYGIYIAEKLEQLTITNQKNDAQYFFKNAKKSVYSSPGSLHQNYQFDDLTVDLSLYFVDKRTALIQTSFKSKINETLNLRINWTGKLLNKWQADKSIQQAQPKWQRKIEEKDGQIKFSFSRLRSPWHLMTSGTASYSIQRSFKSINTVDEQKLTYESEFLLSLEPFKSDIVYTAQSYFLNVDEEKKFKKRVNKILTEPQLHIDKSKNRWQSYLNQLLKNQSSLNESKIHLSIKSLETLLGNWRSPAGAIKHEGVSPSTTARWFNGLWAWDSWKHAYSLASIHPELAKNIIRSMFDYQIQPDDPLRPQDSGMVIDAVFYNKDKHRDGDGGNWNERNTKPPLASWAIWRIYEKTKDKAFIKELFPKLERYHQWWYRNRDHNQNGLIEYGATKHTLHNNSKGDISFKVQLLAEQQVFNNISNNENCHSLEKNWFQCFGDENYKKLLKTNQYQLLDIGAQHGAGWESGMDNAARFGFISPAQLKHYADENYQGDLQKARVDWQIEILSNYSNEGELLGFSLNQESVELNAYLAQEKIYLAKMAELLEAEELAKEYFEQSSNLKDSINNCFFDDATGFYYDRKLTTEVKTSGQKCTGELLVKRGKGPEGWSPLWTNIASNEHALKVKSTMLNKLEFNSYIPFGTAALSNPAFDPDIYWRGRVWLDQFYFAVKALKNYGFEKEADIALNSLLERAQGLTKNDAIRENYNPVTGQVQGATNFSWSAAHLLMLLQEK